VPFSLLFNRLKKLDFVSDEAIIKK
jgi:hypothetical protein